MKNQTWLVTPLLVTPLLLLFFLAIVIFLRNQDANYQLYQLMKKGKTSSSQGFKDSIDFIFENNLIFINLKIKNIDCFFLFDTSSPTCISNALIQKLALKKQATVMTKDEKENWQEYDFFFTNIKIQNIDFKEIAVKKMPTSLPVLPSQIPRLDGIIGANLLQHCIWQIDYPKQKIYFADRLDLLPRPKYSFPVSFTRNVLRTPRIYLTINNFPKRPTALVSTGNTESIILNQYFSDIRFAMLFSTQTLESKIITKNDTLWSGYANTLAVTDLKANHVKTVFSNQKQCFLGNEFLKNYILTIDWKNRKMYFENH